MFLISANLFLFEVGCPMHHGSLRLAMLQQAACDRTYADCHWAPRWQAAPAEYAFAPDSAKKTARTSPPAPCDRIARECDWQPQAARQRTRLALRGPADWIRRV